MTTLVYTAPAGGYTFQQILSANWGDEDVRQSTSSTIQVRVPVSGAVNGNLDIFVTGSFTYSHGDLSGGVVNGFSMTLNGPAFIQYSSFSVAVQTFLDTNFNDANAMVNLLMSGGDSLAGSSLADQLLAGSGADTVSGGGGADVIVGGDGASYLRGDDGDDQITGGANFDDINGNVGDDTASGGLGDDWVVGGKDNDSLTGEAGDDIVYGNLGDDICVGGDGADLVRGGQQNDSLSGGAGDDWLSGDRDSDTISGGAGADIFHTFGEAGVDRVIDFSRAEGDRVMLDPGTTYTVSQQGADVVVAMGGGGQMVLVNVQLSSLTGDWIFGA